jgi:hypothetical protein
MANVEFTLKRHALRPAYTVGRFMLGTQKICDTLEDRVRDYNHDGDLLDIGETKIFGETAIPYGRYRMTVSKSPKFGRDLVAIHDVKHFESIRIHAGNSAGDSAGCILPGENKIIGGLENSRYWENVITAMVKKFIENGFNCFINII